jgi:hypothetical protein
MSSAKTDTVAARIGKILADRIITCQLAPGARLAQDPIAGEFGASYVPVRKAFAIWRRRGWQSAYCGAAPASQASAPRRSATWPQCAPRWRRWPCVMPRPT